MTFRASGKQVLRGDQHIADAASNAWAARIAALLNLPAELDARASVAERKGVRRAGSIYRVIADDIRAGVMEG